MEDANERSVGEWSLAVQQQAAIARLGQVGLESHRVEDVLREALVAVAEVLGISDAALFEFRPDSDELAGRVMLREGRSLPWASMRNVVIPAGNASLPGFVASENAAVVVPDLLGDPRFVALAPAHGMPYRAAIGAPIGWEAHPFGVLVAYDTAIRTWTDDDLHFVQAMANTVGLAIQRATIEADLQQSNLRLDLSLTAGGLGGWSWDVEARTILLSGAAFEMYGLDETTFGDSVDEFMALVHPDDRLLLRDSGYGALADGHDYHHTYRIIRPDNGEIRWVEVWGRVSSTPQGSAQIVGVISDITDRRLADQHREALLEREKAARIAAETARERLAFLAAATGALSEGLDPAMTVEALAELCVPALADICFIDLVDEDGVLGEAAGRGASATLMARARVLRALRQSQGNIAPTKTGQLEALGGRGVLYSPITDELMALAAVDEHHHQLLEELDTRSTIMVPLTSHGRTLGVLTLLRVGMERLFDHDDLVLVRELGARAALALENGRLFASRNRVARSLQAALLPPALPSIDGLALAVRYAVAETDTEIGGDFYDIIPTGQSRWGIVVGDVCGRGPDAAALTGLVRHSVRGAIIRESQPSRVLEHTNRVVLDQIDDFRFCTAAYLQVAPGAKGSGRVQVVASCAGHPRPVVIRASGTVELLDCAGTLLGVVDDPQLVDAEVELGPGDSILVYTDGVTEARGDDDMFGEERLFEFLQGVAGRSAEDVADALEAEVAAFRQRARDDMAILVVQAVGPS